MYAYVTDGTVQAEGTLPRSARRLDTGQWVLGLHDATIALQQACGWYQATDTARPADTATTTYDRSVELVDGTPTVVWTERPKTQSELDAEAEREARQERDTTLEGAISTLQQWADDAAGTTVTSDNAVQVLGVVVDRLGVFFDRFADLLENRYP